MSEQLFSEAMDKLSDKYISEAINYKGKKKEQNIILWVKKSVVAATIIRILFMPCLVGALLGIIMKKFFGKKQFLYFLPFIISIVVYIAAVFMGLGMISVKEVIWIALFLISGFLLSKEKVWGCLFGMIPGIVFVWMSTNDTGQVINIELPLGITIIGFFVGCGIGIYRKSCLKK